MFRGSSSRFSFSLRALMFKYMFDNIRIYKTKIVKVRKKHQCIQCGVKIAAKQNAVNTTYSYDGRLVSVYYCCGCNVQNQINERCKA